MMPYLKQIYNDDFFKKWGNNNRDYIRSTEIIVDRIFQTFRPKRVVDIGCGCGVYSHFLKQKGVDVLSLDGVIPLKEVSYLTDIQVVDLTVPFENRWGKFDLSLCFEVAEHIPSCFSDPFLKNLVQFSDRLLLSCAPPRQGGTFHVNEQPKRYWVEKLSQLQYSYNRTSTGLLQEAFKNHRPEYMWMCDQISVYERVISMEKAEKNLPFKVRL